MLRQKFALRKAKTNKVALATRSTAPEIRARNPNIRNKAKEMKPKPIIQFIEE